MKFVKEGNLSQPIRDTCMVLGLALIRGGAYLFRDLSNPMLWLCVSLGTFFGGVGGACHLAGKAGIKPFDNNCTKARVSYKTEDDK